MPEIKLYGYRRVPYTEKCRRALLLKRLEFELIEPARPEDIRRFSPHTGLLPVMTVDGELVSDSTNILLRLEQLQREPALVSEDPTVAAQQRQLEDWADESFLWYFQEWQRLDRSAASRAPRARRFGMLRARLGGAAADPRQELLRGLEARLDDLVNLLGGRPFFYADRVSMADLTVYGMLASLRRNTIPGASALVESRTLLLGLMRRVEDAAPG